MKRIVITGLTYITVILNSAYGQSIMNGAMLPTTFAQNGDPITNVIDANGSKQGDFMYQDAQNRIFYKEIFSENVLMSRHLNVGDNQNPQWRQIEGFVLVNASQNNAFNLLKETLHEQIANWDTKQVVMYKLGDYSSTHFVGTWNPVDIATANTLISNYLINFSNVLTSNYQFILE